MPDSQFELTALLRGGSAELTALLDATAELTATPSDINSLDTLLPYYQRLSEGKADLFSELLRILQAEGMSLNNNLLLRLQFALDCYSYWLLHLPLADEIRDLLKPLQFLFVWQALRSDRLYTQPGNALRQTMSALIRDALGWAAGSGKSASKFYSALETTRDTLLSQGLDCVDETFNEYKSFAQFAEKERERAEIMQRRICESEAALIRVSGAQQKVVSYINQQLEGATLPASCLAFLRSEWCTELQNQLISSEDAPIWNAWKQIIPALKLIFKEQKTADEIDKVQRLIPKIKSFIENPYTPNSCPENSYQIFITELSSCLTKQWKNESFKLQNFQTIDLVVGISGVKATVSQALLKKQALLKEGDWFLFQGDESIRCKLALKFPGTDQLLFVDSSGRKALQKSTDEFVLCLSSKIATPLKTDDLFSRAYKFALEHLLAIYSLTLDEKKQAMQETEQALLDKQKEAEEKLRAEVEQRRQSAIKARQESAKIAEEKQRKHDAVEQDRKKKIDLLRQQGDDTLAEASEIASKSLAALRVGNWLDLTNKEGEMVRCKVAIIMQSTGKYLLVDRLGIKVAELMSDELIERLISKQALIVGGENFEDRLALVIGGLKKGM